MPYQATWLRRFTGVFDPDQAQVLAEAISDIYGELARARDIRELKRVVQELAEAQKRTEVRVEELAEAQKRTEVRVEELAEAQKRTEVRVEELSRGPETDRGPGGRAGRPNGGTGRGPEADRATGGGTDRPKSGWRNWPRPRNGPRSG
jgi:predicted transcriptional regulator